MPSSRRTRRRRQQESLQRHQLRLEGLEKRYALNAAPVLDPSASPQLNSFIEDAGIPVGQVGTLVSDLIDDGGSLNNFSDVDGDLPGIGITGVNLQGGTLYYSTDNGARWSNVGTVSDGSARVLYADSDTRLAFTPAANFSGSISDVFTLKTWDRTGGHSNGEADVPTIRPSLISTFDTSDSGRAATVALSPDGKTAYVADARSNPFTDDGGLQIINISDPENPTLTGTFGTAGLVTLNSGGTTGVTLSADGNTAYVVGNGHGLLIINVSNPGNPTLTGTTRNFSAGKVTLSADGNTAYVTDYLLPGLHIIDVSDPGNPTLTNSFRTSYSAYGVTLSADGNTAYVAAGLSGLQIINVSDPGNPTLTGTFDTSGDGGSIFSSGVTLSADGNTAYVGEGDSGLQIINVSDPGNPTLTGTFDASGGFGVTLSADGNMAYVTGGDSGIYIINVSDPGNPTLTGTISWVAGSVTLSADGNTAYVAAGGSGLQIIDLGDTFSLASDTVSVDVNSENDLPTNSLPTLNALSDITLTQNASGQLVRLGNITAGAGESQNLRVTATSSNPSLIQNPFITTLPELSADSRLLSFAPQANQYGVATITVTVEDAGLDGDLGNIDDNGVFSQTFDVTVTPDSSSPILPLSPYGAIFVNEAVAGNPDMSYQIPALNVNGEAINGLLNRITATSGDTALIPDPTVLYASVDVPSSLSFTPVANANGTATLSIQVEDGGPDNDFATTEDNRQATHQVEVTVLEIISNQGSAILAKDSSDSLYVNTQPVIYNQQQVPQAIFGSSVVSADTSDSENALLLQPLGADAEDPPTHRLLTDETWRINGIFNSLQNASSPVLDLSGREVSVPLNIVAVAGAYEINGVNNPTLIVRRGQTYTFNLNTAGHPFYLQTAGGGYQSANGYDSEFTGNSQTTGEHQWVVPEDAPDEIFYQCEFHPVMFGKIIVVD